MRVTIEAAVMAATTKHILGRDVGIRSGGFKYLRPGGRYSYCGNSKIMEITATPSHIAIFCLLFMA